jgi:hypothetical protein
LVFAKGNISDVEEGVFDGPVSTNYIQQLRWFGVYKTRYEGDFFM